MEKSLWTTNFFLQTKMHRNYGNGVFSMIAKKEELILSPLIDTKVPENGARQGKDGINFLLQDRNVIVDWYDAFFRANVKLQVLADGAVANSNATLSCGSFTLIKSLKVTSNGNELYSVKNIHKLQFIRKALSTSEGQGKNIRFKEWWRLMPTEANADAAGDGGAQVNGGKELRNASYANLQMDIPLKEWGFFAALKGTILPFSDMKIEVELQDDKEIIFSGVETSRVVLENFKLVLPKLVPKPEMREQFISKITEPKKISFLLEKISQGQKGKMTVVSENLSSAIPRVRQVFFFIQQTSKVTPGEKKNPFFFQTFETDGAKLTNLRLRYGATEWFPDQDGYKPSIQPMRIYSDALSYGHKLANASSAGSCLTYEDFIGAFPFVFFDLRNNDKLIPGDQTSLLLEYTLSQAPTEDHTIFVATLQEMTIEFAPEGGITRIFTY